MPRTNKKYSPEFKIQVIETKIKEKLSSYEAARKFNVFKKINGYEYPAHNYILAWERVYLTEGKEGFFIEKRGKGKIGKSTLNHLESPQESPCRACKGTGAGTGADRTNAHHSG